MIIVKTKQGDIFLDDKVYFYVEHLHSKRTIGAKHNGGDLIISEVESVRYISDAEAIDYTDKGSEVENLQKQVELLTEISGIKGTIIQEFRYLYASAYGFIESIAGTKEPPTDSWNSFVAAAKKFEDNAGSISDLKIGSLTTKMNSLYKALEDVTKNRSV